VKVGINESEQYAIVAAAHAEVPARVLKQDDTFMVFDRLGDINAQSRGEQGLYRDDTRFLSFLEPRSSSVRKWPATTSSARST
jgi:hypothetical protein